MNKIIRRVALAALMALTLSSFAFAATTTYTITASMNTSSVAEQDYEKVGLYISCSDGTAIKGYITRCNASGTVLETYSTKSADYSSGTLYWNIPWSDIATNYRAYGYAYAKIDGTWYQRKNSVSILLA